MKRINIIVEGQTEESFIKNILAPYFRSINSEFILIGITVETSRGHKGGDMKFDRYKNEIMKRLNEKDKPIVTSMIDLYKLREDFPFYDDSKKIQDKYKRVEFLEKKIEKEINNERFVPYIQLHEFEGLLFSDIKGFKYIDIKEKNLEKIEKIIRKNPNPELIDDGDTTAPSKRLSKIINRYEKKKVVYGDIIAEKIGIEIIMNKCLHFKEWINKLLNSR